MGGKRTNQQCRTHHQKMILRHQTADNVIKNIGAACRSELAESDAKLKIEEGLALNETTPSRELGEDKMVKKQEYIEGHIQIPMEEQFDVDPQWLNYWIAMLSHLPQVKS